ncbi:MAG: hypothetical protein E7564_00355 [Ruminococcaceae bacterium]|nr:hypothetical protein [Oscillospiraceae bacterium]
MKMNCPWCGKETEEGFITQDRYAITWRPIEAYNSIITTIFSKNKIKLTSSMNNTEARVFYCRDCRKFIIDQDNIEINE